jgi:hypothetical protein
MNEFFISLLFKLAKGSILVGKLIYKAGDTGSAYTVSIKDTNTCTQGSMRYIQEHSIILETKDGIKYETTFRDVGTNIFPDPKNRLGLPDIGEKFSVKYLKNYPKVFVIISDDDSPYAKNLRCMHLRKVYYEAKQILECDSMNSDYKEKYIKARDEYIKNGCGDNIEEYYL